MVTGPAVLGRSYSQTPVGMVGGWCGAAVHRTLASLCSQCLRSPTPHGRHSLADTACCTTHPPPPHTSPPSPAALSGLPWEACGCRSCTHTLFGSWEGRGEGNRSSFLKYVIPQEACPPEPCILVVGVVDNGSASGELDSCHCGHCSCKHCTRTG